MNWLLIGRWVVRGLSVVPAIYQAVLSVERLKGKAPGPEKRADAIQLARDLVAVMEGTVERDVLDDEQVAEATGKVIDAVVALLNAISDARARIGGH